MEVDLSMNEEEKKMWRETKNANARERRKRQREMTSAPLQSAPDLTPFGWDMGWNHLPPLPLPPGGSALPPTVALELLRNLGRHQQFPQLQALPPTQLLQAPNTISQVPDSTTTDDDALAVNTTMPSDALQPAPTEIPSEGQVVGEDNLFDPAYTDLTTGNDDLSLPELPSPAPVVPPPNVTERDDSLDADHASSLGLLAQAASGADHAGSLLMPTLDGAGSAVRVNSIVDKQTKEKLHKDSCVLFKLCHLFFHFLWIIIEWAEGGKGPMLYVQGGVMRVHLRNRYFDNMNALLKTPTGRKATHQRGSQPLGGLQLTNGRSPQALRQGQD